MNDDIEFLEYIYQNTKMEIESIARILKIKKNDILNSILKEQLYEYNKIANSAMNMLKRRNREIKDIGIMSKIATYMSIKINSKKDNPQKDIIDMLIKEKTIQVDQIKKHMEEYRIKCKTVINLANRLIHLEENHVNILKKM